MFGSKACNVVRFFRAAALFVRHCIQVAKIREEGLLRTSLRKSERGSFFTQAEQYFEDIILKI